MDHSTGAPGARWLGLMGIVELSGRDSEKTFPLLPWYVITVTFKHSILCCSVGSLNMEICKLRIFGKNLELSSLMFI